MMVSSSASSVKVVIRTDLRVEVGGILLLTLTLRMASLVMVSYRRYASRKRTNMMRKVARTEKHQPNTVNRRGRDLAGGLVSGQNMC